MNVTMTITLSETEARKIWERCVETDDEPPLGQNLADWLAEFCIGTIESNFQYHATVDPVVTAGCASDTVALLQELTNHNELIGNGDDDTAAVRHAKIRHQEIIEQLVGLDDPELSDHHLELLYNAYSELLAQNKETHSTVT